MDHVPAAQSNDSLSRLEFIVTHWALFTIPVVATRCCPKSSGEMVQTEETADLKVYLAAIWGTTSYRFLVSTSLLCHSQFLHGHIRLQVLHLVFQQLEIQCALVSSTLTPATAHQTILNKQS